jgi:Fe-S-cluster-containing hydrogenase component 2
MEKNQGKADAPGPAGPQGAAIPAVVKPWTAVQASKGVVVVDKTLCTGCRTCEAVCSVSHDGVINPELARIQVLKDWTLHNIAVEFEPVTCLQCANPPCLQNCPVGAIKLDTKTNARVVDQSLCIGCHTCEESCPFDPPRIRYNKQGKAFKCDLCRGNPRCVNSCPIGALKYIYDEKGISWTGYPIMGGV